VLVFLGIAISFSLLSGCGTPGGAPVVTRSGSASKGAMHASHYRVRRGDTLFSIAWRHKLDHKRLAAWNGIKSPYTIYPGQRLRLKPPVSSSSRKRVVSKGTRTQPSAKATKKKTDLSAGASKSSKGAAKSPKSMARSRLQWQWPTKGKVVQRFSRKDPTRKGVKIAGRQGQAIYAAESGRVVYSGSGLIGYGQLIIIKHNKDYLSAYGHNRKLLVKEGDDVTKGDRIAEMGIAGGGAAVLHFEIRRQGKPVDPGALLSRMR